MNTKEEIREEGVGEINNIFTRPLSRKSFFKWTSISGAALILGMEACKKSDNGVMQPAPIGSVDLGSGDIGILNYAYALEQLEAAFYTQAASSFYSGISSEEKQIIMDIRDHEIVHRDFFKAALGSKAIEDLEVDFSSIKFSDRMSVLGTAKTFEDIGVSAYNGAGYYIQNSTYLLLAGKIVSVEARHAAAIRDILNPKSADFAGDDVVMSSTGLDVQRKPSQVLPLVAPFVKTQISANDLP
jgi:Ferritin-like domain